MAQGLREDSVLLSQPSHIGPQGSSDRRGCSGDPTVAAPQMCQVRFHSEAFALAVPPPGLLLSSLPCVLPPHFTSVSRSTEDTSAVHCGGPFPCFLSLPHEGAPRPPSLHSPLHPCTWTVWGMLGS